MAYAYNCAVHSTTGETPYYLAMGREPMFPYNLILSEAEEREHREQLRMAGHDDIINYKARITLRNSEATKAVQDALRRDAEQMKDRYDRKTTNQDFAEGEQVMLKKFSIKPGESSKHADRWTGRYRIIKIHPGVPKATIRSATDPKAGSKVVHFDQIKSEPYPIGEIQPNYENTDQNILITPRREIAAERGWKIAEERRQKEIEHDPKVMLEPSNTELADQIDERPMSKRQRKRMRRRQMMKQRNAINTAKQQQLEESNELSTQRQTTEPYVTKFGRTIRPPKRYDQSYAAHHRNQQKNWHRQPNQHPPQSNCFQC